MRAGRIVPLIPRYLDLLLVLVERRHEAVHRHAIFDAVWSDVVVSEGALTQAVRSLRRALCDDPREPRFIRTVSRHGYQFVFQTVEELDDAEQATPTVESSENPAAAPDKVESALAILLARNGTTANGDARRDAAEQLHSLGTEEALRRLDSRPGHERARALLRDARWEVLGAGHVPILGQPGALLTAVHLAGLRLRRVWREIEERWAGAAVGGGLAGALGGTLGGLALCLGPHGHAALSLCAVLALLGAFVGGVGAVGVGAGLVAAEAVFRSARGAMIVALGAIGGSAIGGSAHLLARWTLEGLFGHAPSPLAGGVEGLLIGAGAGLGYALATHPEAGGMAAPRGMRRAIVVLLTGVGCGVAGLILALTGHHSGAMSLELLARSFPGSQVSLEPLARLLGEVSPGLATRLLIGSGEGALFGAGLAFGLTRRPR